MLAVATASVALRIRCRSSLCERGPAAILPACLLFPSSAARPVVRCSSPSLAAATHRAAVPAPCRIFEFGCDCASTRARDSLSVLYRRRAHPTQAIRSRVIRRALARLPAAYLRHAHTRGGTELHVECTSSSSRRALFAVASTGGATATIRLDATGRMDGWMAAPLDGSVARACAPRSRLSRQREWRRSGTLRSNTLRMCRSRWPGRTILIRPFQANPARCFFSTGGQAALMRRVGQCVAHSLAPSIHPRRRTRLIGTPPLHRASHPSIPPPPLPLLPGLSPPTPSPPSSLPRSTQSLTRHHLAVSTPLRLTGRPHRRHLIRSFARAVVVRVHSRRA